MMRALALLIFGTLAASGQVASQGDVLAPKPAWPAISEKSFVVAPQSPEATRLGETVIKSPARAGTIITFAPQGNITGRVALWAVSGCPAKVVPISTIYALATHRGIPWIAPKTAGELFQKKSVQSYVLKGAGYLSGGGAVVAGSKWVEAKPQITAGLAIGAAVLVVFVPMVQKALPRIDSAVGGPLTPDGCQTSFYAAPSNVAGFNEVLP
jgi:hypothetical protein